MKVAADASSTDQAFQPEIRRARIDKLTIYEISDAELETLEKGFPTSVLLNFAIFLTSVTVTFTVTLLTVPIAAGKLFNCFVLFVIVGYIGGIILLILWLASRQTVSSVVETIRKRLPPEGEPAIPVSVEIAAGIKNPAFQLLCAHYGSEEKQIDVTMEVAAMVEKDRLVVTASNDIAGDPHELTKKSLHVLYLSKGRIYRATIEEDHTLTLPE